MLRYTLRGSDRDMTTGLVALSEFGFELDGCRDGATWSGDGDCSLGEFRQMFGVGFVDLEPRWRFVRDVSKSTGLGVKPRGKYPRCSILTQGGDL